MLAVAGFAVALRAEVLDEERVCRRGEGPVYDGPESMWLVLEGSDGSGWLLVVLEVLDTAEADCARSWESSRVRRFT